MPPKRKTSPGVSHHRKKARVKVLQDTLSSTASTLSGGNVPLSFTRNFSIRRLLNGCKGQRRAKAVPCHDNLPAPTVVDDGTDDEHVDIGTNEFEPSTPYIDNPSATTSTTKPRKKRKDIAKENPPANKTSIWLTHRDSILDELIRQDGRGIEDDHSPLFCGVCRASPGSYRCTDCSRGTLFCQACIVDRHMQLQSPLHRIEVWTDHSFDKTTLRHLGLVLQLGHSGNPCPNPMQGHPHFTVFHVNSAQEVDIRFCGCIESCDLHVQLLRAGLYPATINRPRTSFTFDCLSTIHKLTLQSKANVYDIYNTMLRIGDNSGLESTKRRYVEILRVVREWRNLMMLKRAGRGHDPGGSNATAPGELALDCPACLHPDCNLPDGWQDTADSEKYLYGLFISVDANFRLTSKKRNLKDIELCPGWAYFVESRPYLDFVAGFGDQKEDNTCSADHDAIKHANTRNKEGWLASGVGGTTCACHTLIQKSGMGDLQKGEKYCNMDYVLLSTLHAVQVNLLYISYDIACQWHKKFLIQILKFPRHMQMDAERINLHYAMPKFHLNAHGSDCQTRFSFNYMIGAARTCGEGIETGWAHTNPLSTSVREMSPSTRHETLDDHWGAWNWQKIIGFGQFFYSKFSEAILMRGKHRHLLSKYTAAFPPETISRWEAGIVEWNKDHNTTLVDVRLQLAQEECAAAKAGFTPNEVSLSTFISMGLELEDQQRLLRANVRNMPAKPTAHQQLIIQQKRHALRCHVASWLEIQRVYMPSAAHSHEPIPDDVGDGFIHCNPEDLPLHLPSSISSSLCKSASIGNLLNIEIRLWVAQADDALNEIRRYRRVITGVHQFKRSNISGKGNKKNTRARELMARYSRKATHSIERYRVAHAVLSLVDPTGSWSGRLRELRDEDIRGPGRDDNEPSKGRRESSWIWLVPRGESNVDAHEIDDYIRVEWAKLKARVMRWEEEVLLLAEEMRRTLAHFTWKSSWWRSQRDRRSTPSPALQEGLAAYAEKQAKMFDRLARKFAQRWLPLLKSNGMRPVWECQFSNQSTIYPDVSRTNAGDDSGPEDEEDSDGSVQGDDFDIVEHLDLDE